jgi:hypothetical protein
MPCGVGGAGGPLAQAHFARPLILKGLHVHIEGNDPERYQGAQYSGEDESAPYQHRSDCFHDDPLCLSGAAVVAPPMHGHERSDCPLTTVVDAVVRR